MDAGWIIVGVFLIVGLLFLNVEHHTRKIKAALIILGVLLLYFSLTGMLNSGDIDLTSPKTVINTVYLYFGWLGETIVNLWDVGKDTANTVGNAIKLNSTW